MRPRFTHAFTLMGTALLTACMATSPAAQPSGGAGSQLTPANPRDVCMVYFGSYDGNQDGAATFEEYAAAGLIPAGYDPNPPSPIVTSDGQTTSATMVPPSRASIEASYRALDANQDGKLTQAELCDAIAAKSPSTAPASPGGAVVPQ